MNSREEQLQGYTDWLLGMIDNADEQVEIARTLYAIEKEESYAPKYESILQYAETELGYKRTMTRLSIRVCKEFMDESGGWLIRNGDEWALTKLFELLPIRNISLINAAIDSKELRPEMTQKEIRKIVQKINRMND